jgi:hypothetical protein
MIAEDPYGEFVRSAIVLKARLWWFVLGLGFERLRLSASIVQTAAERSRSECA